VTDQQVTFAPGETTKTVFVTTCGDMVREPTEKFSVTLTGADITHPDVAVVNIHDTANRFRMSSAICITPGAPASYYPATINVTAGPAQIGSMRVTLYDAQFSSPANMDVLLVSPQGQSFVLMNGAGGSSAMADPETITFSDAAGQVLSNTDPFTSGEFEPTSWQSSVADFAPPAPAGPYNLPGSTAGGNGTQTLMGNYGLSNANGIWSLYIRDSNGSFSGCINGGWGLEFLGPTAGNVSLSGRVTSADGRGIRNAKMVLTGDSLQHPLRVNTGSFGHYSFDGLEAGQTYVVTVNSKRYTFSTPSQVITMAGNAAEINFQADPER